ncbi:hypothetical protein UWK_02760 [Desulfocapsa sulfexigens DSM 10523]|uniref:ATP-grasp domain-containing protein n=1 Tax=Desulfocapsa sulfexigens (strain DSM 10523 / SB164P1) TaxID=1167006 RepID=M1PI72_DESSD|nr:hypothetical protein [Desulfocapsa sulfexigens]AGF79295.1 hypothetical protein UWK_02760 [Desulfocapsa sulfexigens DSM 10523]
MTASKSLRKCISDNTNELVIYGADSFSQFPRRDASVHSKCDRAVAAAGPDDLVILRTSLDHDYYDWLRSCSLGSNHVIEYNALSTDTSLTELIIEDPGPVLKVIEHLGQKPVYTPWFSGYLEEKAAKILGAEHFGTSQAVAQKYNDKGKFKAICQQLEIPVVAGDTFTLHPEDKENSHEMIAIIRRHLVSNKSVIIRGTLAESAYSLYKTTGVDLEDLYHEIADSGENQVLIEPFLDVTSTPNDQWAIGRDGSIDHFGILDQVCEQGLVWVGNIKGQQLDPNIYDYIHNTSHLIVTDMAKSGYCGVIGIDYIVCEDGVFPVENNARFNGSSYVSMVVNNIEQLSATPVPFWKFIKTATSPCSFPELADRLAPHLYDGSTLNSVLPLNCKELSVTGGFNVVIMAENMHLINDIEQSLVEDGVKRS